MTATLPAQAASAHALSVLSTPSAGWDAFVSPGLPW